MGEDPKDNIENPNKQESMPTASMPGGNVTSGRRIGSYKLLRVLGEGGFATVYLAEQHHPVKRRVALKVLKLGMDSKQILARFEAERQALALLDHPNITQIYDGGISQTGRPYFVMEHVKGVPITEHCDKHRLKVEDRLHLFLHVCDGVHHAHQKGIVHRDIKPSNVVVSLEGQQAIPKIIDFGIAKALAQPLTEQTLFTEQGQMMGTPEYMSPEQAAMTNQELDARSDVYSLGVLLYELLSGSLPFDRRELTHASPDKIRRIIREEDPPKPSTRLSSLGREATEIATSRQTKLKLLIRCLHRELEWIPLKAMRKEAAQRYETASELADDIRRYLAGTPLVAGPPTMIYQVRKYVRKHSSRWLAVALFLVTVANTAFTVVYAGRMVRRTQQQTERFQESVRLAHLSHFLDSWWGREVERARSALDELPVGSVEEIGARFLLDRNAYNEARLEALRTDRPGFFWLIMGESHLRNKEKEAAIKAYRQCQKLTVFSLSELDHWSRFRAMRTITVFEVEDTAGTWPEVIIQQEQPDAKQ